MKLIINGRPKDVAVSAGTPSVASLVCQLCHNKKNIMAEINGDILSLADWETTVLKEGDRIELVAFVGGG